MSLLVVSGANKVAQGVIRGLHSSGKYEQIVVADVFPSYYYVQRYLNFKDTLAQNNTKLSEVKLTDMTDLETAITKATDVVYVTHDYYQNVPSKLNLIKHTAQLSKKVGVKKLLAITPVENDHYGEQNAIHAAHQSENEARLAFPGLVELKTDITFGPDSNAVNEILTRLIYGKSIFFKPSGARPQPVSTVNVAQAAQKILESSSLSGLQYVARGPEQIEWVTMLNILAVASNTSAQINKNPIENLVSPLSDNLLSQTVHHSHYLNFVRLINQYQNPRAEGHLELANLGVTDLAKFSETYKASSISANNFKIQTGISHWAYCL